MEREHKTHLLTFMLAGLSHEQPIYKVFDLASGDLMGSIDWHSGQYCFTAFAGAILNTDHLRDLINFIWRL